MESPFKVFGIGMPKTGTNSLTRALHILGFRPALHNPFSYSDIYDCGSATDLTIAWRFPALDWVWPDSKFIYTYRNLDDWVESAELHWHRTLERRHRIYDQSNDGNKWGAREAIFNTFGTLVFDRTIWLDAYSRQCERVERYFSDKPDKLLITNITDGRDDLSKWTDLCTFLDVPIPIHVFPHENKKPCEELQPV